jgi:3-oxoacyl-[acyl-carrier-protein] synthase-1
LSPISIDAYTSTSAAGIGNVALCNALLEQSTGLRPNDFAPAASLDTWIGRIAALESVTMPAGWHDYECRNQRLACLALEQDNFSGEVATACQRFGDTRIGCLIGSSTSGMLETELGYRSRSGIDNDLPKSVSFSHRHSLFAVSDFVRRYLGLRGPVWTISTACTSSAKVFGAATRLIDAGLCDAVVVGGVDTLCLTTLHGFRSLELLSDTPCRPFAANRKGISIGEGAGFALLSRTGAGEYGLLGYGESSDGFHISTPAPKGVGAQISMRLALDQAGLDSGQIDYINLHGTATENNDRAEQAAVLNLFGTDTPCSSTKGWTGHTLGAAGITEAVISLLCLKNNLLPGTLNTERFDPEFTIKLIAGNRTAPLRHVLSNSFGFGGSNCSLVFGKCET